MKIVCLMGGLGNQMFQYAFGKLVKAQCYDVSWFDKIKNDPNTTQREYELDFFKLSPRLVDIRQTRFIRNNKLLEIFGIQTKLPAISEKEANVYDSGLLNVSKGIIKGYFQVAKYYDNIRSVLLEDFVPKEKPDQYNFDVLQKIKSTNSIAIHVRRGDYVKLQHIHGLCSIDYYQKAIEYIVKQVKNPHFFLFSDDITWVLRNLNLPYPVDVIDFNKGKNSAWDMWLMKNCQHNIIANSTFSWWGAWLNENPEKVVIAPKQWFVNGKTLEIIPNNWIRV